MPLIFHNAWLDTFQTDLVCPNLIFSVTWESFGNVWTFAIIQDLNHSYQNNYFVNWLGLYKSCPLLNMVVALNISGNKNIGLVNIHLNLHKCFLQNSYKIYILFLFYLPSQSSCYLNQTFNLLLFICLQIILMGWIFILREWIWNLLCMSKLCHLNINLMFQGY